MNNKLRNNLAWLSVIIIASLVLVWAVVKIVSATPEPKVFICKFIGEPGINERLQTGQNPINVSQNSIKDFQGVGSYFNDAHGRSYVLAIDVGQDEPSVDQCPAPETPEEEEETPVTTPGTLPATTETQFVGGGK